MGEFFSLCKAEMPTDKARVATYIDHELNEKLKALAQLEDRSVSNFLERLIKETVAKAESEGKLQ
jgi:predicted transcriptional regulator